MALFAAFKINRCLTQARCDLFINPHLRFKTSLPSRSVTKSNENLVKSAILPLKNDNVCYKAQQDFQPEQQHEFDEQMCSAKADEPYDKAGKLKFAKEELKREPADDYEPCNLQPAKLPQYYSSSVEMDNVKFPDGSGTRRIFPKSSTHSALTVPLKLSRLANPFPEQVIVLPSQRVSDQEKAEQMENEIKMEARFRLEQQQEQLQRRRHQQQQQQQQQQQERGGKQQHGQQRRHYSTLALPGSCGGARFTVVPLGVRLPPVRPYAKCKKPQKRDEEKTCPKAPKASNCKEAHEGCVYPIKSRDCKKLSAPYPSYSECMDEPYEELPDECRDCPWKSMPCWGDGRRKFSTSAAARAADVELKKVKPCPNPYPDKQPCEYERAAELKKKKQPRKGGSAGKKKSASPAAAADSADARLSIASMVKGWLTRWGNESEVIKVSRPDTAEPGKETYVVEIYEDGGPEPASSSAQQHDPQQHDQQQAAAADGAAGAPPSADGADPAAMDLSCDRNKKRKPCKKIKTDCGKPKEKKQPEPDKKCKKPKKRKLPSCDERFAQSALSIADVQDAPAEPADDRLATELNIDGMPPAAPSHDDSVYKLKKQHWKVTSKTAGAADAPNAPK